MSKKIKITKNDLERKIRRIVDRRNNIILFFKRVTFEQYKRFQLERWKTENVSQGKRWKPLGEKYKKYKIVKYRNYPGKGTKLLVATGNLLRATVDKPFFLATRNWVKISTNTSKAYYAEYVHKNRPISGFNNATMNKFIAALKRYIVTGEMKVEL